MKNIVIPSEKETQDGFSRFRASKECQLLARLRKQQSR
jgi:hypothetical protein